MPVIECFSPCSAPSGPFLQTLCEAVQETLQLPDNRVWAIWHRLEEGSYFKPSWQQDKLPHIPAPIVKIRCKTSYSQQKIKTMMNIIAEQVCAQFSVSKEEPYILVDLVLPGQLLVRGKIWED